MRDETALRCLLCLKYYQVQQKVTGRCTCGFEDIHLLQRISLKKNQNAPRPSEHPPVRGGKCQNV